MEPAKGIQPSVSFNLNATLDEIEVIEQSNPKMAVDLTAAMLTLSKLSEEEQIEVMELINNHN